MPLNNPNDYDSQSDWMSYCVPIEVDAGKPQDQAVAICGQYWRDRNKSMDKVIFKAGNLEKMSDRTATFIASDESEDRHGDIIRVAGWDLKQFKRNPVLLWGHRSDEPPIGKVTNIGVRGKQLVADVKFLPKDVSEFAEQIYQTVKAGILNAVSVGFMPIDYTVRKDDKGSFVGYEFTKQSLHELSIVSVPSNPNALAIAKALHIDCEKVFAPPVVSDTMKRNRRAFDVLKLRV